MAEEKFNWKDAGNFYVDIYKYITSKQSPNLSAKRIKEIENIIKYAETYSEDFNKYKATYKREIPLDDSDKEKADLLADFFVDEANKRKDFEERLKLATQHDKTEAQNDLTNQQAPENVEQQPDKAEINVKNENAETDKANVEQQSNEKIVKEERKNDAFFGKITRNNAGNNGNKNLESVDNLATAHSQIITLPNFPGTKKEQKLSVFDNFATGRNQNTKKLLIDIRKGYEPIAAFKIDEDTNKILLDVYDENLIKIFNKKNLNTKGLVIDSLELDKKLDIRVKALGKDIGVLFSAYGFQMKAKGPRDTIDSAVLKNEDAPYDIEIGERFLDMAIQNEFSDKENKNGCLLGNDMRLNSPTMQSLLRMASVNNLSLYDGISQKTLGDKDDKNKQIILTSTSFQFYDKNGNLQRRPMDFMEINGKPYVYLSIVEGAPNKEKREHAGRFYELSNINITNDNHVFFTIKDKSLVTIDREAPNSRTLEIPFATDKNGKSQFIMFAKDIYEKYNFEKNGVRLNNTTNATLSNREYGTKEEWRHVNQTIHNYDSAGFIRHDNAESVLGKDNIDKNKEKNTLDSTVSAQGTAVIYDNSSNSYNFEESSIVSEGESSTQENGGAENGNADENVFFSANSPQKQNEENPDENKQGEQEKSDKEKDKQGEQEKSDKEKEKQDATAEAAPQDAPPPPPPATGNNEEKKEENKEDKSETGNTIFDQPFLENKEKESFSPDASNKLAATLGITFTGIGMLLVALACFLGPLVGFIGCTVCFGLATVSLMKPWELRTGKSKDIIDKNLALVKERQKELERDRKADLEGQKNAQKEAKKAENKSKNQKRIDNLNKKNEELENRMQELDEREQALLAQNAILLTGLSAEESKKFEGYDVDKNGKLIFPEDANLTPEEKANLQKKYDETTEMSNAQISAQGESLADYDVDENNKLIFPEDSKLSPEEKAELQKEYDEIIEISKQNEKEIGLTREEREQNHFNDYAKTVDELNEINAKLDKINKSSNENNNLPNENEISDEHAREVIERDEEIGSLKKQKEELENRLAYQRDIVQNDIFAKMQRTQAGLTKEEAEKSLTSDQRTAVYNYNMRIIEAIRGEKRQIKKLRETNNNQIKKVEKKAEIDNKKIEVAINSPRGYSEFLKKSYGNLDEQQKVTEAYAKNVSDERERYRILTDSIMKKMEEIEKLPKDQRDEEYAKMNLILSSLKRSAYKENEEACEQLLGMLKNSSAEKEEKSSKPPSASNKGKKEEKSSNSQSASEKGKEEAESSSPQSASEKGKKEEKSSNPTPASNKEGNEMGNSK